MMLLLLSNLEKQRTSSLLSNTEKIKESLSENVSFVLREKLLQLSVPAKELSIVTNLAWKKTNAGIFPIAVLKLTMNLEREFKVALKEAQEQEMVRLD